MRLRCFITESRDPTFIDTIHGVSDGRVLIAPNLSVIPSTFHTNRSSDHLEISPMRQLVAQGGNGEHKNYLPPSRDIPSRIFSRARGVNEAFVFPTRGYSGLECACKVRICWLPRARGAGGENVPERSDKVSAYFAKQFRS